jgi:hypothetical protein
MSLQVADESLSGGERVTCPPLSIEIVLMPCGVMEAV